MKNNIPRTAEALLDFYREEVKSIEKFLEFEKTAGVATPQSTESLTKSLILCKEMIKELTGAELS